MHKTKTSRNQGFAHIGIILAVVGVLVVGGLVAWRFMGAMKTDPVSDALAGKLAAAKCDYDDKDICKFFTSWKEHKEYRMISTTTEKPSETAPEGAVSKYTIEIDGENAHTIISGSFNNETIAIGKNDLYTKSSKGVWWKQKNAEVEADNSAATPDVDLQEPTEETTTEESKDTTTYKALGKEACGTLTCFKYQVINSGMPGYTEFIWFDTKSYQLRRTVSEDETAKTESTFSYENVTVKAPSSFKELGPNQYLIPGEAEPTNLPSAADYMSE